MKVDLSELRSLVEEMILEAKKSKKKKDAAGTAGGQFGSYAAAFDFSQPLGAANPLRRQGQASFGPYTNTDDVVLDDRVSGKGDLDEEALRSFVRSIVEKNTSAWEILGEPPEDPEEGPWADAMKKLVKGQK